MKTERHSRPVFTSNLNRSRRYRLLTGYRTALAICLVGLSLGPSTVRAAVLNWTTLLGGSAGSSTNWNPSQIPVSSDDLTFNLSFSYPVSFPASVATVQSHTYRRGNVTMTALVPHTATNGFTVGSFSGDDGDLTLAAGSLTVNATANVGDASGSVGILTLDGSDATMDVVGASSDLNIGRSGTGTLEILGGAEIVVDDDFIIGATSTGSGAATISGGAGALPNLFRSNVQTTSATTGDIIIGNNGSGTLDITAGGIIHAAHDVKLAVSSTSTANVDVSGAFSFFPSSIVADRNLDVARNDSVLAAGTATLTLNTNNTAFVGGLTRVGDPNGGSGSIVLNGGFLTSDGGIDVQSNGTIAGTGEITGNITNLGLIQPTGANGLTLNGVLSNTTNGVSGTRIFFDVGGGYTGSGNLNVEIAGNSGSLITATGALVMGRSTNVGVSYVGDLNVGSQFVSMVDTNGAVLGGVTTLSGGTLQGPSGIGLQNGGRITGLGQLLGNTIISGELDPHSDTSSGGTIDITGTLTINPTGIVDMEIGGSPASSANDRVNVTGAASFDGSVRVRLKNGYVPHVGEQFIVANATLGRSGTFAAIVPPTGGQAPCNDVTFVLVYSSTAAIVLVRPPLGCTALGDLNSDGTHDGRDIQPFVNALLSSSYDACADMNGDCDDDANDIPIFLNARL